MTTEEFFPFVVAVIVLLLSLSSLFKIIKDKKPSDYFSFLLGFFLVFIVLLCIATILYVFATPEFMPYIFDLMR